LLLKTTGEVTLVKHTSGKTYMADAVF